MRVVLELEVDDLPANERKSLAADMNTVPDELPGLESTTAPEAASVLGNCGLCGDIAEMLFEGSDVFVTFTASRVVSAGWIE